MIIPKATLELTATSRNIVKNKIEPIHTVRLPLFRNFFLIFNFVIFLRPQGILEGYQTAGHILFIIDQGSYLWMKISRRHWSFPTLLSNFRRKDFQFPLIIN